MRFDVVSANLHVVSKQQVTAARGIAAYMRNRYLRLPDVIGCQEGIQIQHSKTIGRYQVVKTTRPQIHDNTCVVLLKRGYTVEASVWHFGAPPFGTGLNHRERHWHEIRFTRRKRKFAVLNAHMSVLPHDVAGPPDSALFKTHAEMAKKISDRADELRSQGYVVAVTADGNVGNGWKWALVTSLTARGYIVARHRIDFVAMHKSQARKRRKLVIVPQHVTHSDHEAVGAGFTLL